MSGVSRSDLDWIRETLADCTPQEVARVKAVIAEACGKPPPAAPTLLAIRDDLADARAILHALDLALFAMPTPDRDALRTVSDIAMGRIAGIIGQVDLLRGEAA